MVLVVAVIAVFALLAVPPAAAAERWRWPVRGEVLRAFAVGPDRFAAGQHRGIDIAASPGTPVRAVCSGRVRFAGRLPGRGRAVSIDCGRLVATHLELASATARRGAFVAAGQRVGVAAGPVQLGARRDGDAFGYVDPLTLLGADAAPPLGTAPKGRGGPRPAPVAVPATPAEVVSPRAETTPVLAWVGFGLLVAGVPFGALARTRRRRACGVEVASAARTR